MGFKDDMKANNELFKQRMRANNEKFKKDIKAINKPSVSERRDAPKKKRASGKWRAMPKWQLVVLLILLFPIGLYLLVKQERLSKRAKRIYACSTAAIIVVFFALAVIFAPPTVAATSSLSPVKSSSYTLTGTISPAGSVVTVNSVSAHVSGDKFSETVQLKEGDNSLKVVVISGSKKTEKIFKIHRYTKAEIAAQEKAAAQKKAAAAAAAAKKKAAAAAAAAKKKAAAAAADEAKQQKAAAAKAKADAAAAAAAQKKAAEAAANAPKVLLDITGSGIKQTQAFTTKSSWTIDYTFDCSNFGFKGNFQIYLNNTDGSYNYGTGPNDLALSGGDTEYEYNDPGGHYLTINSECDWHVIVKS